MNQVTNQNKYNINKNLFWIILFCVLSLGGFLEDKLNILGFTRVQVELKYQPKDLDYNLDADKALIVIMNPTENKEILFQLIAEMHLKLLHHTANNLSFSLEQHQVLDVVYRQKQNKLVSDFMTKLIELVNEKDGTVKDWYRTQGENAVSALSEVMSMQACPMLAEILPEVLGTTTFEVVGKGAISECEIMLTTGVKPLVDRLAKSAQVFNMRVREDILNKQITSTVAKFSTVEITEKKGIKKEIARKIFGLKYSSTNYEIHAMSIIAIGCNIKDNIKVSFVDNKIIIILPEPEILYHIVYPIFENMDIGYFAKPDKEVLNRDMNILREEFQKDLDLKYFDESKKEAEKFIRLLVEGTFPNRMLEINFLQKENLQ